MEEWIHPNTILGPAAEGDKYFDRVEIEEKFWREINKGSHILFTAPRRVGKSSVMKSLAKKEPKGYLCVYQNIESDSSSKDLYKRLFNLVITRLDTKAKTINWLSKFYEEHKIKGVSVTGNVEIETKEFDFKEGLFAVIEKLKDSEYKVVLFLDEFPDVISSISKKEGADAAREVLHTVRELRQNEKFTNSIVLILAGSIGLSHVVSKVEKQSVINDLFPIEVDALKPEEAIEFIITRTSKATMKIDKEEIVYLIKKIGYLLPYYIQLVLAECDSILYKEKRKDLSKKDIDDAYRIVIEKNDNFRDWSDRLRNYFHDEYGFFIEVLTHAAHNNILSIQEALNIGIKYDYRFDFKRMIDDVLAKDGYLVEGKRGYKFLSPFLQDWWKGSFPIEIINN